MGTIALAILALIDFYIFFELDKSEKSMRHLFLTGGLIFAFSAILDYFEII